jgi:hypothetical protein
LKLDSLTAAGTVLTAVLIGIFAAMVGKIFPFQTFGSPPEAFGPSVLGAKIGLYLWNFRFWDLTVVAFILFFSALGCIAMLREEEVE